MATQNLDATLQKMGLILEKVVQKIDELDTRVAKLEEKVEGKKLPLPTQSPLQPLSQNQTKSPSTSSTNWSQSFLGSLAGAMAGMGLYNLLFNHDITPMQLQNQLHTDTHGLDESLEEIEEKLDVLDDKLDTLDDKIDLLEADTPGQNDFEGLEDVDFDDGFDDFGDIDDI